VESDSTIRLEMKKIDGVYEGRYSDDGSEITGTWTQAGQSMPLKFVRLSEEHDFSRPQDPQEPYPYDESDVTFDNTEANVRFAGTLTTPRDPGPHPAVILVSGSGPQDRDETVPGHRPFLVLADHLTRQGIAVLRFDDRGFGKSTGNFRDATHDDHTTDVLAGVGYLMTQPGIVLVGSVLSATARGASLHLWRQHSPRT